MSQLRYQDWACFFWVPLGLLPAACAESQKSTDTPVDTHKSPTAQGANLRPVSSPVDVGTGEGSSATADDNAGQEGPAAPLVACVEPRPQVCTREYNPVCAEVDTGVRCITTPCPSSENKTYPTGCTACADKKVLGYSSGSCEKVAPAP